MHFEAIIFANWRGFSGGTRDMYNEILKLPGAVSGFVLCWFPFSRCLGVGGLKFRVVSKTEVRGHDRGCPGGL